MLTINSFIIKRKVILIQKGFRSVAALAAKIGYSRPAVCKAVNGNFKSVKQSTVILDKIANELGVVKEEFWPEFYGETENGKSENVQQNAPQCF